MNKKTYEILPEGQVKIIEEVVTTEEKVVNYEAVEKRVAEIDIQVGQLQEERAGWADLLASVDKNKLDAKLPDNISAVPSAAETITVTI